MAVIGRVRFVYAKTTQVVEKRYNFSSLVVVHKKKTNGFPCKSPRKWCLTAFKVLYQHINRETDGECVCQWSRERLQQSWRRPRLHNRLQNSGDGDIAGLCLFTLPPRPTAGQPEPERPAVRAVLWPYLIHIAPPHASFGSAVVTADVYFTTSQGRDEAFAIMSGKIIRSLCWPALCV